MRLGYHITYTRMHVARHALGQVSTDTKVLYDIQYAKTLLVVEVLVIAEVHEIVLQDKK